MPVELYFYSGNTPTFDAIDKALIKGESYEYIVATTGLQDHRKSQKPPDILPFTNFIRKELALAGMKVQTSPEERTRLRELMQEIAASPDESARLRHDVTAWMEALAECVARNIELRKPLPVENEREIVGDQVGSLLMALDVAVRAKCLEDGSKPLARALVDFIQLDNYQPSQIIVMEGFTFLTPLQRRFVDACQNKATVKFLIPYNPAQKHGFAVMDRTYKPFGGIGAAIPFPVEAENRVVLTEGLELLRSNLFADEAVLAHADITEDVLIQEYRHQSEEVSACIRSIHNLINAKVKPDRIAIVTRDPGVFHARLREEAQFQNLPVALTIPARHLLLTPLGRFALLLYKVLVDDELILEANQFEAMLSSGWLGGVFQGTVQAFQAVRWQFFRTCRTRAEWEIAFDKLDAVRAKIANTDDARMSAGAVTMHQGTSTSEEVDHWRVALEIIEKLSRRIYDTGNKPFPAHVKTLLTTLELLDASELRDAEQELLQRIKAAFQELEKSNSIDVTPDEFGEVLNSMISAYGESAVDSETGEEKGPESGKIWVTTPEGIDNCERDYVFYLGVDSERVPRRSSDPWPFYRNQVANYQEKERYLFLAVVRATRKRLTLSYSKLDEAGTYDASIYLQESARLLENGIQVVPRQAMTTEPIKSVVPKKHSVRRENYMVSELAIFGLCPYRYKIERLSQSAKRYRSDFHAAHYAASVLEKRVLDYLTAKGEIYVEPIKAKRGVEEAIFASAESLRENFPGLREGEWFSIRNHIEDSLKQTLEYVIRECGRDFNTQFVSLKNIAKYRVAKYTLSLNKEQINVSVNALQYTIKYRDRSGEWKLRPLFGPVLRSEWLLPTSRPRPPYFPVNIPSDGAVFESLGHAVGWWDSVCRSSFYQIWNSGEGDKTEFEIRRRELTMLVQRVEEGDYPKNPGEHCTRCPARAECLGVEQQ